MSTFDEQFSMWPTQREQRRTLNDVFTAPRPVEHFAHFRRRGQAESAARELSEAGHIADIGRRGLKTTLRATRDEPLSDDDVSRFLREVITIVERNRGDYDGWGATVEASPSAAGPA